VKEFADATIEGTILRRQLASPYVKAAGEDKEKDNDKVTVKVSALLLLGVLYSDGKNNEKNDIYHAIVSEGNTTGKITVDDAKLKCTFRQSLALSSSFLQISAIWYKDFQYNEGNRTSYESAMDEVYGLIFADFLKDIFDDKKELSTADFKAKLEKKGDDWMNAKNLRTAITDKAKSKEKAGFYIEAKNSFEALMGDIGDGASNLGNSAVGVFKSEDDKKPEGTPAPTGQPTPTEGAKPKTDKPTTGGADKSVTDANAKGNNPT